MCTEQIEERMVLVRAIYLLCSYVEAQQICDKTTSDGCCHDDGPWYCIMCLDHLQWRMRFNNAEGSREESIDTIIDIQRFSSRGIGVYLRIYIYNNA